MAKEIINTGSYRELAAAMSHLGAQTRQTAANAMENGENDNAGHNNVIQKLLVGTHNHSSVLTAQCTTNFAPLVALGACFQARRPPS